MGKQVVVVAVGLTVFGCINPRPAIPPVQGAGAGAAPTVHIRVRNVTNIDFDTVMVRFPTQTEHFGAVAVRKASDYRSIDGAYRYAYVEARNGDRLYVAQPIDFVGESFLSAGRYTYNLEGRFSDKTSVDAATNIHGFMSVSLKVDSHGT